MRFYFILFVCGYLPGLPVSAAAAVSDSIPLERYLAAKKIQAEKDQYDIFYTIDKQGNGMQPRQGDYIKMHYIGRLLDGYVFDRSLPREPFVFQLGYGQVIRGWDLAFPRLRIGSKATIYLPAELAYGDAGVGEIPPGADLIFDVELLEIMTAEAYDAYMADNEEKERKAFEAKMAEQFAQDKKMIHEYAVSHQLKVKRTDSGLSYAITKAGKGPTAQPGNTVKVHFEGYLPDGTLFQSSLDRNEPFQFVLGTGKVIPGWEEGLRFFNKGSQGWLLLPSRLGYGATPLKTGEITIPANSLLIFKIKVLEIF